MKVDFEAEVVSAINKIFPDSVITGCKFHFSQCLCRHLQNIHLNAGIQRKRTSPTHMQFVCCFGTHYFQQSRRSLAYDHGNFNTE